MAVNRDSNKESQAQAQSTSQSTEQTKQPQQEAPVSNHNGANFTNNAGFQGSSSRMGSNTLTDINTSFLNRTGRPGRSEGRVALAVSAFKNAYDPTKYPFQSTNIEFIGMGAAQAAVPIGSLLIVRNVAVGNERLTIVRPLFIDTKEDEKTPNRVQFGGETLEIDLRPSNLANSAYWDRLCKFVHNTQGERSTLVSAGPMTLPREFDLEDLDSVQRIIEDSETRIDDAVAEYNNEPKFSLTSVDLTTARFVALPDFGDEHATLLNGLPARADLSVRLNVTVPTGNAQQNVPGFSTDQTTTLSTVNGFVNLYPVAAPQQQQAYNMTVPGQQQDLRCLAAQYVITNAQQGTADRANTPEIFLLSLINAYQVTENNAWMYTFMPRLTQGRDWKDLAAIGFWVTGKKFDDVKSAEFGPGDLAAFLGTYLQSGSQAGVPGLSFAIDVDPTGENSQVEQYLLDAAQGNANSFGYKRIFQAADSLTGGAFQRFFKEGDPIVEFSGNMVSLGYNEADGKRDVRELDTIAMLNLTDGDSATFNRWLATQNGSSQNLEEQLTIREAIERRFLPGKTRYTGRAFRLVFSASFITALAEAARQVGFNVRVERVAGMNQSNQFIPNSTFQNNLVSGHFNSGYSAGGSFNLNQNSYGFGNNRY